MGSDLRQLYGVLRLCYEQLPLRNLSSVQSEGGIHGTQIIMMYVWPLHLVLRNQSSGPGRPRNWTRR